MAKGSEARARKLHAKPEALAARGRLVVNGSDLGPAVQHANGTIEAGPHIAREHGTGDVARENAERVANVAGAHALLSHTATMAEAARQMIASVVGATHPAAMAAQLAHERARQAEEHAKQLLRAIGRAL